MAEKEIVRTERAPAPFGRAPYNQAIRVGELVFVAGQLGLRPGESEMVGTAIAEQTEQVMKNLSEVLRAAGAGLADVIKTTVYLSDMNDFAAMNEVYGRFFPENPPARSTVQAARLPRDARVEIDVVAIKRGEG